MIKKLITNLNFFFLVFFFIFSQIPFLEFLEKNISDLDFIFEKILFFLNFLILVLLISFSYLVYIVSKKKISLKHCFLIALTFYILFFQHNSLKFSVLDFFNFLGYENFYYNAEISFVILLLISSIISYFLIRDNFFIKRFVYILFILIFLKFNKFTISFINLEKNLLNLNKLIFKDKLNEKRKYIFFYFRFNVAN